MAFGVWQATQRAQVVCCSGPAHERDVLTVLANPTANAPLRLHNSPHSDSSQYYGSYDNKMQVLSV